MSSFRYSPVSVTEQPLPSSKLSLDVHQSSTPLDLSEKYQDECQQQQQHLSVNPRSCEECHHGHHSTAPPLSNLNHRRCHGGRLRSLLIPTLIALLVLGGALAYICVNHGMMMSALGMDGLIARAVDDTTTGGESFFTKHKLYLVVIFVGLLVVIILAIMLSAWCCKGAFRNPLCCPCYLCACCGGLACLECIGCGLCAEGLTEM